MGKGEFRKKNKKCSLDKRREQMSIICVLTDVTCVRTTMTGLQSDFTQSFL